MSAQFICWEPTKNRPEMYLTDRAGSQILMTKEGRVFVRGEETKDVERIGAAYLEWAQVWAELVP